MSAVSALCLNVGQMLDLSNNPEFMALPSLVDSRWQPQLLLIFLMMPLPWLWNPLHNGNG